MGFLSEEQQLKVRLRGSKVIRVEELDGELRAIKLSAHAQEEAIKLQAKRADGKVEDLEFIRFMLEHGITDMKGRPCGAEGAAELFGLLGLETITKIVVAVTEVQNEGKAPPAPKAEPAPAPTPTQN